jgi:cell division protein ZapA
MATPESSSVEVEIFDVTYRVRGFGDSAHLQRVAKFVDERMRNVASHLATVDATKIAVLAAMNIADECLRGSPVARYEGERGEITEKVLALAGALEEVLDPPPVVAEDR